MDEITVDSLLAYKDFLIANGYAGKTIDTRITNVYFLLKKNGVTARLPKDEMPIVEVEAAVPYTEEELTKLFAAMNEEQRIRYKFSNPCQVLISWQGNPNPVASDLPKNERRKGRFRGAILKEAFFLQSPIPKCEGPGQHARVHTGFND